MEILPVRNGDELDIIKVAERSWKYAYNDIYTDQYIQYWINKYYAVNKIKTEIKNSIENANPLFYGLFDHNVLVGFIEINKINKILLRFYLEPTYTGHGYGTQLFNTVEKIIMAEKISNLKLYVNQLNHNAISFYKKLGFQIIKEDNEDYIMEKYYNE